jgi:hypothetical protein
MYYRRSVLADERRSDPRIRVEIFLNQYIRDQPFRALALNLSPTGLRVQKLSQSGGIPRSRVLSVELELPGTGEVLWARAESRFDSLDEDFHTSGLTFTGMARKHEKLLRDFVVEKWLKRRSGPLFKPRPTWSRNRDLGAGYPTPQRSSSP